jgi:hypothetical protein
MITLTHRTWFSRGEVIFCRLVNYAASKRLISWDLAERIVDASIARILARLTVVDNKIKGRKP